VFTIMTSLHFADTCLFLGFQARFVFVLLALLASATAFVPAMPRAAGLTVRQMGYVPDGLTPEQWKKKQGGEAAAKAANKKKVATTWGVGRTGQEKVRTLAISFVTSSVV
jgi:hypothetical protein